MSDEEALTLSKEGPPPARRDLLAGLTVAALALPSGIAYAEVAGLPLVNGLYALLLPTVLYTLLGSSRQLIVGPEGSIADQRWRTSRRLGGRAPAREQPRHLVHRVGDVPRKRLKPGRR